MLIVSKGRRPPPYTVVADLRSRRACDADDCFLVPRSLPPHGKVPMSVWLRRHGAAAQHGVEVLLGVVLRLVSSGGATASVNEAVLRERLLLYLYRHSRCSDEGYKCDIVTDCDDSESGGDGCRVHRDDQGLGALEQ